MGNAAVDPTKKGVFQDSNSHCRPLAQNVGAKCPVTLIDTPENRILEAVTSDPDHVLKQTKETL
ncbi:hypothetical protein D623_10031928 [Myotis brandtii]|uniref:Uncharacterized protein n=1 Tax=Myotis brandtii TaxID=109478 RepID=S7PKG1_MYOBR|nr:hypothetical protein D623_10031928 [Myotis brandtii]